ncbi:hypothetical protein V8C86DRAFT_2703687, partial [Haematococcus lacustris]
MDRACSQQLSGTQQRGWTFASEDAAGWHVCPTRMCPASLFAAGDWQHPNPLVQLPLPGPSPPLAVATNHPAHHQLLLQRCLSAPPDTPRAMQSSASSNSLFCLSPRSTVAQLVTAFPLLACEPHRPPTSTQNVHCNPALHGPTAQQAQPCHPPQPTTTLKQPVQQAWAQQHSTRHHSGSNIPDAVYPLDRDSTTVACSKQALQLEPFLLPHLTIRTSRPVQTLTL